MWQARTDATGARLARLRCGLVVALLGVGSACATEPGSVTLHTGMCDASAAIAVGESLFIAANDEDNILRVYRQGTSGPAVHEKELSAFLAVDPKHPEADIEGGARLGSRVYWATSHGRNTDGKVRDSRRRFFATEVRVTGNRVELQPVGTAYATLNDDLARDERLRKLGIADAIGPDRPHDPALAPKASGLNLEALAGMPDGKGVFLGFRNPRPGGRALVVPLTNPDEVVSGNAKARLGEPILLSLDGLGIRDMAPAAPAAGYLILAGPTQGEGPFRLYAWSGDARSDPTIRRELPTTTCPPEGLTVRADGRVLLVRDCGVKQVGGQPCKSVKDRSQRSFESVLVSLEPAP